LVNNLETYYRIAEIAEDKYEGNRFYSFSGEARNNGVFDLSTNLTIGQLLRKTGNELEESEFVQLGGGASGSYYIQQEIEEQKADEGTGTVIVYNAKKFDLEEILEQKLGFLIKENCGKCTPCREGIYRMYTMIKDDQFNLRLFKDISLTMSKSSFCGFGVGAGNSLLSLLNKKNKIWKR